MIANCQAGNIINCVFFPAILLIASYGKLAIRNQKNLAIKTRPTVTYPVLRIYVGLACICGTAVVCVCLLATTDIIDMQFIL